MRERPLNAARVSAMLEVICMKVFVFGFWARTVLLSGDLVAMFRRREAAVPDRGHVGRHGADDGILTGHEVTHEARLGAGSDVKRVVQNQHLA